MARFTSLLAAAAVITMQIGCSDAATMLQPGDASLSRDAARAAELGPRRIEMLDACDPTTFNAAVGPGTCTRSGGITFARFIDQLTNHQKIDAWRFAPSVVEGRVGQTLLAMNRGGEVHTFTEVEAFGGGIVPMLNQLSGNPTVAPECLALEADDFIAPGGSDSDDKVEDGTELYQCCIHPWMRTTVHGHKS
jgi:hypothetical protein